MQYQDILFNCETGTSYVYFTSDRIYKIKKNVRMKPFIDYTTRNIRERKIEIEFLKGLKHTPEVYIKQVLLSVEDVNKEPCICMKRMASALTVYELLSTKGKKCLSLDYLLKYIKKFVASSKKDTFNDGDIMSLEERFSLLFKEVEELHQQLPPNYSIYVDEFIDYYKAIFNERCQRGCIIKLHGDLHTGNILFNGENYYLFDFLDFDDSYTTGDYLYDIGFLLADIYYFQLIKEENSMEKLAEFFEEDVQLLYLFSAFGALNRANVFACKKEQIADVFYEISYQLLCKGCKNL